MLNHNVFHLPNLGENLTDEDQAAFHFVGLPLPQFHHGERDCTADYYADDDRRDAKRVAQSEYFKSLPIYWRDRGVDFRQHETSAGLSHAQRVMRKIDIAHDRSDELDSQEIY